MYKVFARKYRPRSFDEVIGQEHCAITLKNAILDSKIAQAYLFGGPRGVGKTSTARILAKTLNCKEGPTPTPCDECTHCKEIPQGNSPDVIEIDGASNRGIDEIRDLRQNARYVPSSSRYKIYIIDEAHMLTEQAFNALLKILEEPPPHIIFILATTQPYKLPRTILSRCQRFNFRKIGFDDMIHLLTEIADKEGIKIEKDALKLIIKKADGALRDAEGLLDQLATYSDSTITEEDVRDVLGLPPDKLFFEIQSSIIKGDTKKILSLIQETIESGIAPEEIIDGFIEHLRFLLFADPSLISNFNLLLRIIRALLEAKQKMRYSERPDIYLMETLTRLSAFKSIPIEEIIKRLEEVSDKTPLMETSDVRVYEDTKEEIVDPSKEIWKGVVRELRKESKSLASIISNSKPIEINEASITVQFPSDFHKNSVEQKRTLIEKHLSKIAGRRLKIISEQTKKVVKEDESIVLKKAL
ncbi:DNA polymerase III subunit gamma/tau, partial [candidate division WOR-3 bacterium]|nr:DNA polymerase III subunit gamma/tau [candidate division WOR-3 bacterium]